MYGYLIYERRHYRWWKISWADLSATLEALVTISHHTQSQISIMFSYVCLYDKTEKRFLMSAFKIKEKTVKLNPILLKENLYLYNNSLKAKANHL